MQKITINKDTLLERIEEDGEIVTRIPGTNQYLYLEPEDIVTNGEKTIVANLDESTRYVVGEKVPEKGVTLVRGDELYKEHYIYSHAADPSIRNDSITNNNSNHINERTEKLTSEKQIHEKTEKIPSEKSETIPNKQSIIRERVPVTQIPNALSAQKYDKEQFKEIRLGQKKGLDVKSYWDVRLSAAQMKQLRLMLEKGINIAEHGYNHPSIPAEVLGELRKGHLAGKNMNQFSWRNMNLEQIRELRFGIEHGVNVSLYAYPIYDADQMKQMRLGLQNHIDIEKYRNINFTAEQMRSLRIGQVFDRVKQHLKDLWESFKTFFQENMLQKIKNQVAESVSKGLDKAVEIISGEKSMNIMFKQEIPQESLEQRISETVQDIKELLVSQELVSEEVMTDQSISEMMETKIRQALDELMQPDSIQNPIRQEEIINQSAVQIVQAAGADIKMVQHNIQQSNELEAEVEQLMQDERINAAAEQMANEASMGVEFEVS